MSLAGIARSTLRNQHCFCSLPQQSFQPASFTALTWYKFMLQTLAASQNPKPLRPHVLGAVRPATRVPKNPKSFVQKPTASFLLNTSRWKKCCHSVDTGFFLHW